MKLKYLLLGAALIGVLIANSAAGSLPRPYKYQSANGTTIVTVGDYLEARAAARFYDAIRDLP